MKITTYDNNEFLADGSPNPNYGQATVTGQDDPPPQPINAGNPYFGKTPLPAEQFIGLLWQTLGARYPRLRTDPAFLGPFDTLLKVNIVDVDDKDGDFLKIVSYLQQTNAQDGQPLLSKQDLTAIMAAWK